MGQFFSGQTYDFQSSYWIWRHLPDNGSKYSNRFTKHENMLKDWKLMSDKNKFVSYMDNSIQYDNFSEIVMYKDIITLSLCVMSLFAVSELRKNLSQLGYKL